MSDEELVGVFDDDMKKLGTVTRREAHVSGKWHLNFHCWIVSKSRGGCVLFQVRSRQKPTFPGLLDSTVGAHYRANQTLRDVVHEAKVEIGLRISASDLRPLGRRLDIAKVGDMVKREVATVFFLMRDSPPSEYRLDRAEVEGLVELPIASGLRLFSGETTKAKVKGIYWEDGSERWIESEKSVKPSDFVPKVDSYYLTIFIMAERLLAGERYLSI
jgi:isopentenyldiphosphate isomerase